MWCGSAVECVGPSSVGCLWCECKASAEHHARENPWFSCRGQNPGSIPGFKAVYYVAQKLKTRFFIINRAGDEFLCLVSRPENLPNFSGQTLISGNLAKIRFCFSGHIINSLTQKNKGSAGPSFEEAKITSAALGPEERAEFDADPDKLS